MHPPRKRIRTSDPLAALLSDVNAWKAMSPDAIDGIGRLRIYQDDEGYEEKERGIPELIYSILRKESGPSTRLMKRTFFEDDAWMVSVECREGEALSDRGHEIFTSSRSGEMMPALFEEGDAAAHFVRIHVPRIFVRTLSLPMIARAHGRL
ncbi:MAG: hypothetical protein AB1324_05170 [Candidatus Micrarchaeota archaeon]